ncbi:HEAT repeat domain-containing protein [Paraflavitalea sp. CAU 1676]|uniref:HEAT repeat domain-containing protein n=1 Tax=Paraflavitalea sp. CAU 1676 TaxID=3032598 RepID=UPI0023DC5B1F|nr:HEAT repeat domain-containing protein [Paraflavitalea sp. CAU 1676]MDF2188531.1 HEAT repeat domain-containing protein [Paraflavitalea sp. CAU 1676]
MITLAILNTLRTNRSLLILFFSVVFLSSCRQEDADKRIKQIEPAKAARMAAAVDSVFKPLITDTNLTLKLWGIDSLVISPIAIDIDDDGSLYYTTTNRQKHSEFDIRGHQDWEIPSIQLQSIEDKRAFLHKYLAPENSKQNTWLDDLNGDSSHDWRDMTVEKDNVYRLKDTDGDGVADQSQLVVDDFHDEVTDVAGGVLKDGENLYVAVGPDLWRMKDKNGDGIADEKTSISHGYGIHIGFSGHGMSGVEMGPDGRIYWQIGDIGFNGVDQTGKLWSYPNCGVIARSNPDGSDFEIFAHGLRNTHEFVFDDYGNLISEDNDGDHAGEEERLVYVVNGADAGWRSNWQYGKYRDPLNNSYKVWMDEKMWKPRWEGQAAYIVPCVANYVSGPAGMAYNPGTALSPAYKNMFFIAKFVGNAAQSGVYGFKLNSKGAGFELGDDTLVMGGILPTGLDFGPDGALYIADWIDGWGTLGYGRIWKLDDKRGAGQAARKQTQALLAADFSSKKTEELGTLLRDADRQIRLKAQFELVKRAKAGEEAFTKALSQTDHQLARIHAIWGLSQLARKDASYAKTLLALLKDKDPEIRAQAAKWLGDIKFKDAGAQLEPLLKDPTSRARFFAAEALGRIGYTPAVNGLIDLVRQNNDEDVYIRHSASLALARIGNAGPLVQLSKDPSRAVRIAAVVALRRMENPGIKAFLQDEDEFIVTEAARGINDDLSIPDALPALGEILTTTRYTNEALLRRTINANLRIGTNEAMTRLITFAGKEGAPAAMRAEAIDALGTWVKPSVVDRVDGRYRGVVTRDSTETKAKTGDALTSLLTNKEQLVRLSAVKAVKRLGISQSASVLLGLLKNDKEAAVRKGALQALASLQFAQIGEAISIAVADKDKSVRVAGIDLIARMNMSKELMVTLLTNVINTKTTEEQQAALLTLGNLPLQYSQPVLEGLINKMSAGKLSPVLYLELAEAIDSSRSSDLAAKYNTISKGLSADTLGAAYAGSLYGGDPQKGRRIFYSNQTAQCIRCHAYDDYGGNAGPRLNGVADRLKREQLLEALVKPSARLAPGYGTVILKMKDGKTKSGILTAENDQQITLKVGDKTELVAKADVSTRTDAPSSMPEMRYLLTKKEIRDVVSFLAELKEEKKAH